MTHDYCPWMEGKVQSVVVISLLKFMSSRPAFKVLEKQQPQDNLELPLRVFLFLS